MSTRTENRLDGAIRQNEYAADPPDGSGRHRREERLQRYLPLLIALGTILLRIPFLLHGEDFFNSDEAVEGLMARHLSDLPVFFWGQSYKGVPEVYLAWLVFKVLGYGVLQLKLVTLIIWSAAVALTTQLARLWYGVTAAVTTGLFLATGPPAVVNWSLCANAEAAWLMLLISGALLAYERSTAAIHPLVFVFCGMALWIHPIGLPALGALGLVAGLRSEAWQRRSVRLVGDILYARQLSPAIRLVIVAVNMLVVLAWTAFFVTFAGRSLNVQAIVASHPQKILRIAIGLSCLAVAAHALGGTVVRRRSGFRALGWLAAGLAPVELYLLRGGVPGAAIINRRIEEMPSLFASLLHDGLPIVFGLRDPATLTAAPWPLVASMAVAFIAFLIDVGRRWSRAPRTTLSAPRYVFALFSAALLLGMLLPGGMYVDAQSYRYFMPYFGLVALTMAAGCQVVFRASRVAGVVVTVLILSGFLVGEHRWYARLRPESSDRQVIACLEARGVRVAKADYWIAYKMTFLSDERVLVLPDDGPGRYVQYNTALHSGDLEARVERAATPPAAGFTVVCTSQSLQAVLADQPRKH